MPGESAELTPLQKLQARHAQELREFQHACPHLNRPGLIGIMYMSGGDGPDAEEHCTDCGKLLRAVGSCHTCGRQFEWDQIVAYYGGPCDEYDGLPPDIRAKIDNRWNRSGNFEANHFCLECWRAGKMPFDYLEELAARQANCEHQPGNWDEARPDWRQMHNISNGIYAPRVKACKTCLKPLEVQLLCSDCGQAVIAEGPFERFASSRRRTRDRCASCLKKQRLEERPEG